MPTLPCKVQGLAKLRYRPSGGPGGNVWALATLPGTQEKGGLSIILEFSGIVQENLGHDKAPSHFIYNSPSTIWNLVNLIPTKSYDEGEFNGAGYEVFGGELTEEVGFYQRINQSALIRIINAFYFQLCLHWPPLLYAKGFPLVLNPFKRGLESFWDRNMGFISIIS